MKNSKTLFQDFIEQVTLPETPEEISSIAFLVFEKLFQVSKTDIFAGKPIEVSMDTTARLADIVQRLNDHEPIQYILGEADFFGRTFKVNSSVLIPRPETEELIREVLSFVTSSAHKTGFTEKIKILDIGSGSGCIAITLSDEIAKAEVYATDVSPDALAVAQKNSQQLSAPVSFIIHDILKENIPMDTLDVVVSNPPYITPGEKMEMKENVVEHEPHLALFVPEHEPLIFYEAITKKSMKALKSGGKLFVEINERYGSEVSGLFLNCGFMDVRIVKDMAGKDRIVEGEKPVD
jgi:release factor glutamine methyltransferase